MNPRLSGYEPELLTTASSRDIVDLANISSLSESVITGQSPNHTTRALIHLEISIGSNSKNLAQLFYLTPA